MLASAFGDFRFVAGLLAALGATRFAAFFLPAFRLGRLVDFFAELLAFPFPFALPRAAAFFGVAFFFAAIGRLVPLIRFDFLAELVGEAVAERLAPA